MPSPSRPQILDVEGVTVIAFDVGYEHIDERLIPAVSDVFNLVTSQKRRPVVVDLTGIKYFSSSFIEQMFRLWNRTKDDKGGGFALAGVGDMCQEILLAANLQRLWTMHPTRSQAVDAVKSSAST
jgi:anti-anti-sigma regulatory factor